MMSHFLLPDHKTALLKLGPYFATPSMINFDGFLIINATPP